ncbi:hypothetical protein AAG570_007205 [Ranatra chinensis]|uniref:t-SNARE coiled-coil homology domain-containing protein n=1 Tax=Ranatra chinensis TaxID=642074 RepID=A0ABD0YDR4_9HEMI
MASKRRNMFYENKKQETEIGTCNSSSFCGCTSCGPSDGTVLDRIDYNIEAAQVEVGQGLRQLQRASHYQRSNRKMVCIVALGVVTSLMTGLLIVTKLAQRNELRDSLLVEACRHSGLDSAAWIAFCSLGCEVTPTFHLLSQLNVVTVILGLLRLSASHSKRVALHPGEQKAIRAVEKDSKSSLPLYSGTKKGNYPNRFFASRELKDFAFPGRSSRGAAVEPDSYQEVRSLAGRGSEAPAEINDVCFLFTFDEANEHENNKTVIMSVAERASIGFPRGWISEFADSQCGVATEHPGSGGVLSHSLDPFP